MKKKLALFLTCATLLCGDVKAASDNMFELSSQALKTLATTPVHQGWDCSIFPDPRNHCVYGQCIAADIGAPIASRLVTNMRDFWFGSREVGIPSTQLIGEWGALIRTLSATEEAAVRSIYVMFTRSGANLFQAALFEGTAHWQMRYVFERYGPDSTFLANKPWAVPHLAARMYVGMAYIPMVRPLLAWRRGDYFSSRKINDVLAFLNEDVLSRIPNIRPFMATNMFLSPQAFHEDAVPPHRPVMAEFVTSIHPDGDAPAIAAQILGRFQADGFDLGAHIILVRGWGDLIKIALWTADM